MLREILVMDCEERGSFWLTLGSGHKTLFSTTAQEGLDMISGDVGLVFLNMKLPDRDGMEVLQLIKRKHPSKAVIIIDPCGKEEACLCMEAFRKGAWDYVKKPLRSEEILRKINAFVETEHGTFPKGTDGDEGWSNIPSHLVNGVLKVRDFLAQNHSESLSLSDACKMASTSRTYFCRFFKRITGYSLKSYHHVVKMRAAEELLMDRRLSVTDVATKLGYSDSNYFSTIYKKVTGVSPKHRRVTCHQAKMARKYEQDPAVLLAELFR